jgi:hypothetical protein
MNKREQAEMQRLKNKLLKAKAWIVEDRHMMRGKK